MTYRTTKILLTLIALGLWANLPVRFLRPSLAAAQNQIEQLRDVAWTTIGPT